MTRLRQHWSAVHLAMVLALSAFHTWSGANATTHYSTDEEDLEEVEMEWECPQPDWRNCPGTPFAVVRDPANGCAFYDCPPAPPGYIDWKAESSSLPPPDCIICTNTPTANMLSRNLDCTTAIQALATRCADDAGWVAGTMCQSSCYFAGRGYDGDVCCPGNTGYPTMNPTGGPTLVPTASPTTKGTLAPVLNVNGSNDEEEIVCDSPFGPKKVGEIYFTPDGCNYCVCGEDGVSACTALDCPDTPIMVQTDIVCPADVLECEGNITLTRDPSAGCEFGPAAICPPTTLPPGTSYKCAENSTGIYPVDMCLGFIWCQDGEYLAGPSLCPPEKRFDGSRQCCKNTDEVNCEVGFGRTGSRVLWKEGGGSGPEAEGRSYLRR